MQTLTKELQTTILPVAVALLAATLLLAPFSALAAPTLNSFTQAELDTAWEGDRFFPTAGVTSVNDFGRGDVARIGVDASSTQNGTFQRTEGIKTVGDQNFGTQMNVDLYIDPDWETKAVRAGLWVVGDDGDENTTGTDSRDDRFGIIEFVNLEDSTTGDSATTNHTGFRIWDSAIGWIDELDYAFEYGEWVTLSITLDPVAETYTYAINGTEVGTATGGTEYIREAFLNSYNYGLDEFPNLSNGSYAAHWHVGEVSEPTFIITEPMANEVVSGAVDFAATLDSTEESALAWAVRAGTCDPDDEVTVAGNVAGFTNPFDWVDGQFNATVDMTTLPEGEYCFVVNATDAELRTTQVFTLEAVVVPDTEAPIVTILSPEDEEVVSGTVSVRATIEDEEMGNYNIALYEDGVDVNDFSLRLAQNNVPEADAFVDEEIWTFDSTAFADGVYQLRLAARDAAGNRDLTDPGNGGTSSVHIISITIENDDPEPPTPTDPTDKNQCKNGGYEVFGFKNQGQCIKFVNTDKDSR